MPTIDVALLWHRRHERDTAQRWLRDTLARATAEVGKDLLGRSSGVTALATAEARAFATEMPTFMPSLARCAGNPSLSLGEALGLADCESVQTSGLSRQAALNLPPL